MRTYLVLDMGGTFIKYGLMDEIGRILNKGKIPSETRDRERLLEQLRALAAQYAGRYIGAAVSMPGRIDTARGFVHTGGSFLCLREEPFAKTLEQIFAAPVTLANDGKCAANAEAWTGALADVDSGAVLVLGTAIGGGVILNRQVLMGHSGGAGEFSLLVTDASRAFERIDYVKEGLPHLWMGIASAVALAREYAIKVGLPSDQIDCLDVFKAYDQGDKNALDALSTFCENVAAGICSVQSVVDVERVAIGGGISARREITEGIRKAVDVLWSRMPLPFLKPEIVPCVYGNDANLIGALRFHLKQAEAL